MDKERGNESGIDVEDLIPRGLTGPIRDKARDALVTATVILQMGRTDILDRIQELAKENGLTPQSARVWLLFSKDLQDRAQELGREAGVAGTQKTFSRDLGYSKADAGALGLDAVFRRNLTQTGIGESPADDLRKEMNREAGHHGDSVGGRNGAFSYDQMVDGWTGAGRDGDGDAVRTGRAGAIGLDDLDGEADLDIDPDLIDDGTNPAGREDLQGSDHDEDLDAQPDLRIAGKGKKYTVDEWDVSRVQGSGSLNGGWHKNAAKRDFRREAAMDRAEKAVSALHRKLGGFRGTPAEFQQFREANGDLDKNELRLLGKGLSDKDYLGFRMYMENGELLDNKGRGAGRISTQTRACLLLASEDSARNFQNKLRKKIQLFARLPDPGVEKISLDHLARMQKSLPTLAEAHKDREVAKKQEKSVGKREPARKPDPELER